jgi:hypothetical protein
MLNTERNTKTMGARVLRVFQLLKRRSNSELRESCTARLESLCEAGRSQKGGSCLKTSTN